MDEIKVALESPEHLYDYELITSRNIEKFMPLYVSPMVTLPVYYLQEENARYLKLNKNDARFYETYTDAISKNYEIREEGNIVWIEYFEYKDYEKIVKDPIKNIIDIPGVRGDFYNMLSGKMEYWRFRFVREALQQVSDYLINAIPSINSTLGSGSVNIEYLGKPHSDLWYLQRYNYSRRVLAVKIRVIITKEYRANNSRLLYPYHSEMKQLDQKNFTVTLIRFTTNKVEPTGVIKEINVLRDQDLIITEEKRKISTLHPYEAFVRGLPLSPLWLCQNYDGTEPVQTWIIDENDLTALLGRINLANNSSQYYQHFVIESIEEFYNPKSITPP